jgi:hypothetical protein
VDLDKCAVAEAGDDLVFRFAQNCRKATAVALKTMMIEMRVGAPENSIKRFRRGKTKRGEAVQGGIGTRSAEQNVFSLYTPRRYVAYSGMVDFGKQSCHSSQEKAIKHCELRQTNKANLHSNYKLAHLSGFISANQACPMFMKMVKACQNRAKFCFIQPFDKQAVL